MRINKTLSSFLMVLAAIVLLSACSQKVGYRPMKKKNCNCPSFGMVVRPEGDVSL